MEALEMAASTVGAIAGSALEAVQGQRHLRMYVSNATENPIGLSESSGTLCKTMFDEARDLRPLSAGMLGFLDRGELRAEAKLKLGAAETEFLGIWVSFSRLGSVKVMLQFSADGRLQRRGWTTATEDRCTLHGTGHAAFVRTEVEGGACALHVTLEPWRRSCRSVQKAEPRPSDGFIFEGWGSYRFLQLAEWCSNKDASGLVGATFLMEFAAVMMGLEGLSLADRAFTLNLLICAFVLSGALYLHGTVSLEALKPDLQRWCLQEPTALLPGRLGYYDTYRTLRPADESLREYVSAAVLLLKTAAIHSSRALAQAARDLPEQSWREPFQERLPSRPSRPSHFSSDSKSTAVHDEMLFQHVGTLKMREEASRKTAKSREEATAEARLMSLVRKCVHMSACFGMRWKALFEAVELTLEPDARKAVRRYRTWVPAAVRAYDMGAIDGEDAGKVVGLGGKRCLGFPCGRGPRRRGVATVSCLSMGAEVFAGLDDGTAASPSQVLESLGCDSLPYKIMTTNSKSGEFFFFSEDRRFLIKTISEEEGKLLFSMLPGYQGHLQIEQESLIVRYAGFFRLDLDGIGKKYFSIMANIFDPAVAIHSTFDVKGSMFKRKAKEGEKTGKDEDWVSSAQRLSVSEDVCSRLCASHEQDAEFLAAFGVMDYSLLIGCHEDFSGELDGSGILSVDAKTLYFVGIIDFLIEYGLSKQGEHFLRFAQGHSEDASCVDPLSYARRQVRFVRDRVVSIPSGRSTTGTAGALHVIVRAAHGLRVADVAGLSDPYVHVTLGLQRRTTPTVSRNCDPSWDCHLGFAVDEAHLRAEVDFSVWDQDVGALQGADDFLGRLRVPVARVLAEGCVELCQEPLKEVKQGSLSVRLEFVRAPKLFYSL